MLTHQTVRRRSLYSDIPMRIVVVDHTERYARYDDRTPNSKPVI